MFVDGLGNALRVLRESQDSTHKQWATKIRRAGLNLSLSEIEKNLALIETTSEWPWLGQTVSPRSTWKQWISPLSSPVPAPMEDPQNVGQAHPGDREPDKAVPVVHAFIDAMKSGVLRPGVDDAQWRKLFACLVLILEREVRP